MRSEWESPEAKIIRDLQSQLEKCRSELEKLRTRVARAVEIEFPIQLPNGCFVQTMGIAGRYKLVPVE